MAKKKKQQLSPKKYIVTKARSLEISGCYITENWKESGIATIVVQRQHKSGNITLGVYLVDLFCKGVKDTFWKFNDTKVEACDYIEKQELVECSYQLAHNIIFESIAFAEENGFEPHEEFRISEYILEDDEEGKVEDIEIHCGNKEGKPLLIESDPIQFNKDFRVLKETVGEGNFLYITSFEGEDYDEDYEDVIAKDRSLDIMSVVIMYRAITQIELSKEISEKENYLKNVLEEANLSIEDFNFELDPLFTALGEFLNENREADYQMGLNTLMDKKLKPIEVLFLFDELMSYGDTTLLHQLHSKYQDLTGYESVVSFIEVVLDVVDSESENIFEVFKFQTNKMPMNNPVDCIVFLAKKAYSFNKTENISEKESIIYTLMQFLQESPFYGFLGLLKEDILTLKEEFVERHIKSLSPADEKKLLDLFDIEVAKVEQEVAQLKEEF